MSAASSPTSSSLPIASRRLALIAPAGSRASDFINTHADVNRYEELLSNVQRFRGRTYLADGAIRASDLDNNGRHRLDTDRFSWHLVALDGHGKVCGCSRYRIHPRHADFSELGVSRAALAESKEWRPRLIESVEQLRNLARQRNIDFVEVGGWAISEELRRTTESIRIALGTYALASLLGGCIGITTATVRHHSATVLRKIGGSSLTDTNAVEIPAYFDHHYDCEMQILKFESAAPNPKVIPWIDQLRHDLRNIEVVTPDVLTPIRRPAVQKMPSWLSQPLAPAAAISA
jgi:hypothetical protein